METGFMNRTIGLVLALVVGGLLVGGLLIPSIEAMTATEKTFENVGYYDMTYTTTDNISFEWDHTKPQEVQINGESVTLPAGDSTNKTILCGDNWLVRFASSEDRGQYVQFFGSTGGSIICSESNSLDLTVNCANGSVSVTDTDSTPNTYSTTYTFLFCVSDNGPYVMKDKDVPAYVKGDSQIYAMGTSKVGTLTNVGISAEGTIDDGLTWAVWKGVDFTFSNEAAEYTTVSGYKDLYSLSALTTTCTKEDQTSNLTYNYFIVPASVTAELTQHMDATEIAMFGVISILGIVALVVVAANGIRNKY